MLPGLLAIALAAGDAGGQPNRIDTVTPFAPELAAVGPHNVGVRALRVTDRNRPDVLKAKEGATAPLGDRTLTLEVWYPAALPERRGAGSQYQVITREPSTKATLHGRAVRDAMPIHDAGAFPLLIISHGYPGNRFLMSPLAENLAGKGFIVVSIDHKDSTYDDQQSMASTLYNRPLDQLFVLAEMDRLGRSGSGSFLAGLVDAGRTGIVGYSMGGYGVVNVIGGGFSKASETFNAAPPNRMLAERGAANPAYRQSLDARVKAAIAIGPWGMQSGYWDADGLKGIRTPVLFVAGSADEVSGYEKGTRAIFQGAVNADRYLLTFLNAGHNAAAPMPAPAESYVAAEGQRQSPFTHYADPVWDTARMNNILQHFATAFFAVYLKGDANKQIYLTLVPNGRDGVYAIDRDGKVGPTHTYWKGFRRGTAVGLMFEHLDPGK